MSTTVTMGSSTELSVMHQRASAAVVDEPNSRTEASSTVTTTLETFKDHQSNVLPHKKLMVIFPIISLAQFTSYLDQTSISTALPAIGSDLKLGPSISWVAASFLIASTSVQLINGRLSDIFGRKTLLLLSLGLLALGNLVAGFATNAGMLFAFRAVSGLGGGCINALVMIIASDITTLKQRGKYNGFIGAAVALGNGIGPLIGGAVTEKVNWRWTFWFAVPWIVFVMTLLAYVLPKSKVTGNTWSKLRLIDWLGLFVNIVAVLLLLIPISEGGAAFSWDSTIVISMLTIGAVMVGVFIVVEWRLARLPMMPMRLFTNDLSANIILIQGVLFGFVYWGNLFYIPVFLQNVHGYDPIISGAIIVPMVASQGIGSIISGQIISRTGHYNPVIISSQFIWTVGIALQAIYSRTTPVWAVCLIGLLQGIGIGGCFQPSLVALLAHSRKADRAVMNSLRNFLRTMGGAVGLTVSGTVLNNVLKQRLSSTIPSDDIIQLTSSVYALDSLDLSPQQHNDVLDAYMAGMHNIFLIYAPMIGACFLAALLVKDNGVAEKDATAAERREAAGDNEQILVQDEVSNNLAREERKN